MSQGTSPTLNIGLLIIVFLSAIAHTTAGGIIYVDADGPGGDGATWETAYENLQDALNKPPVSGDEIRVAQGTYRPAPPDGDRNATFQLINGVVLKGGYAGFGAADPNARDLEAYQTILSGDLNGDDEPNLANNGENSCHVLSATSTSSTTVLDGFTIKGGNANILAWPDAIGGGMFNDGADPTLIDCTFSGNSALYYGGGMYNYSSDPNLINCTFNSNIAKSGGAMYNTVASAAIMTGCTFNGNTVSDDGAGIYNSQSNSILANCTFAENSATDKGGAIYNYYSTAPTLANCAFNGNTASDDGAGMYNYYSNPTLTQCTFNSNTAHHKGGGMHNFDSSPRVINCIFLGNNSNAGAGVYSSDGSEPELTNCIFSGNAADNGAGLYNNVASNLTLTNCTLTGNWASDGGGGIYNSSNLTMSNCILWSDTPDEIYVGSGSLQVTYSDVQDGWAGDGNISTDPNFVQPGYWDPNNTPAEPNDDFWVDGDYHLKSQAGHWNANTTTWVEDNLTSRCIDAGNPGSALGDEPNDPGNVRINFGAYGGTAHASKTPANWSLLADLTNDGITTLQDFTAQAQYWMIAENQQPGDLNRNGIVDTDDLALLAQDWLQQTIWHQP